MLSRRPYTLHKEGEYLSFYVLTLVVASLCVFANGSFHTLSRLVVSCVTHHFMCPSCCAWCYHVHELVAWHQSSFDAAPRCRVYSETVFDHCIGKVSAYYFSENREVHTFGWCIKVDTRRLEHTCLVWNWLNLTDSSRQLLDLRWQIIPWYQHLHFVNRIYQVNIINPIL
jgi:hypothetical protein